MCILLNIVKKLLISIISAITFFWLNINYAYASNNIIVQGSSILTSNGKIAVEKLDYDDRVISYDFQTHKEKINKIKDIKPNKSLSYYLINNQIKIIGTEYVYVKTPNNTIIKRAYQLKNQDKLLGQKHQDYTVSQIKQVIEPYESYQITLQGQEKNFYLDEFLVYLGAKIPNNFNKNYIHHNCGIGSPYPDYRSAECLKIHSAFPQIIFAIAILTLGWFFSIKLINWIRKIYLKS